MKKVLVLLTAILINQGCSAMNFKATTKKMDLDQFMGTWYVQTGRVTFLEKGAHNPTEIYTYNSEENRIDIDFTYNKDSLNGKLKAIPQKGWVHNAPINTHWKVSPIWPLKLDYLVLDFAKDYSWCAIGVPSGKYLWVMTREKNLVVETELNDVMNSLKKMNYPLENLETFKHSK